MITCHHFTPMLREGWVLPWSYRPNCIPSKKNVNIINVIFPAERKYLEHKIVWYCLFVKAIMASMARAALNMRWDDSSSRRHVYVHLFVARSQCSYISERTLRSRDGKRLDFHKHLHQYNIMVILWNWLLLTGRERQITFVHFFLILI